MLRRKDGDQGFESDGGCCVIQGRGGHWATEHGFPEAPSPGRVLCLSVSPGAGVAAGWHSVNTGCRRRGLALPGGTPQPSGQAVVLKDHLEFTLAAPPGLRWHSGRL